MQVVRRVEVSGPAKSAGWQVRDLGLADPGVEAAAWTDGASASVVEVATDDVVQADSSSAPRTKIAVTARDDHARLPSIRRSPASSLVAAFVDVCVW